MFGHSYWGGSHFGQRYWGAGVIITRLFSTIRRNQFIFGVGRG
jgi:hypothetical protein